MKKLRIKALLGLLAALCLTSASRAETTYAVLLDVSASIPEQDRRIHRDSFSKLVATLQAGDRLILSPVGWRDRSTWTWAADVVVPKLSGRRFLDEKRRSMLTTDLTRQLERLIEGAHHQPEPNTRLLETITATAQVFEQEPDRERVLLILSDMMDPVMLNKTPLKATPSLAKVRVYVSGAGGSGRYAELERAWRLFFNSAPGAQVRQYGRLPFRQDKGAAAFR